MKRLPLYAAGVAVALVPAVVGLAGNASFSQSVPVKAPASTSTSSDDPPGHDANDDRVTGVDDSTATPTPTPRPRATRTAEPGDDHGRRHGGHGADDAATHDAGDDHGGDRDRSGTSGRGGADDPATHDAGDDHGGDRTRSGSGSGSSGSGSGSSSGSGGSDDSGHHSGGDDGGSGGHGSDD